MRSIELESLKKIDVYNRIKTEVQRLHKRLNKDFNPYRNYNTRILISCINNMECTMIV